MNEDKSYVDYEVIYLEDGELRLQQFRYETNEDNYRDIISQCPLDLNMFKKDLLLRNIPFVICVGELKRDTGFRTCSGAYPVYPEKPCTECALNKSCTE